jgi:co-chaperonin GroES (HSP10)
MYGDNILVKRTPLPKVTAGGIYLANPEHVDATAHGVIVAVGPGKNGISPGVESGLRCAYLWHYAESHKNKLLQKRLGEDYVFLKADDIILVWDEEDVCQVSDMKPV